MTQHIGPRASTQHPGRFGRDEIHSQQREGQHVDQGPCPHAEPADTLPCLECFGGESR